MNCILRLKLCLWVAALVFHCLALQAPVTAQSPFTSGLSFGNSLGAPTAMWQRVDSGGATACLVSLAPAEPGYSASLAASRATGHGQWLMDGALDMSSASQLSSQSGHIGLTFTFPGSRTGLLQMAIGARFAGGNGVMLDSELWPVSNGRQGAISAGLRWAPSPLITFHVLASKAGIGFPISEQEVGMNTALSPTICLSLGLHAQQDNSPGTLATAAVSWQPRVGSTFAISLEENFAHNFGYEPFFDDSAPELGATPQPTRYSQASTLAIIDTPISSTLTLRLSASLGLRGGGAGVLPAPAFIASLFHHL